MVWIALGAYVVGVLGTGLALGARLRIASQEEELARPLRLVDRAMAAALPRSNPQASSAARLSPHDPELQRFGAAGALSWVLGSALLVALLVSVQTTVGWRGLMTPWLQVPVGTLALASTLLFASYAVRAIRVHSYFMPETRGAYLRALRVVGVHNLLNNLLPLRSGEASFPILMRREFGVPLKRSVPGLMYLRLLDLHLVLMACAVLITWSWAPLNWLILVLLCPLPALGFLGQERLRLRIRSESRFDRALRGGLNVLPATAREFAWTWFWTGANWAVKLLVLGFVLRAFVPLPFVDALVGSIAGELSSVLPFHGVAGAGTYEGGVIAGLMATGNRPEAVLTGAVNLHMFVLGASVIGGLIALLLPGGSRSRSQPLGGDRASERPDPSAEVVH